MSLIVDLNSKIYTWKLRSLAGQAIKLVSGNFMPRVLPHWTRAEQKCVDDQQLENYID